MAAPRWRTLIENAISKHNKQTVIQVATLDSNGPESDDTVMMIPRVRSQIFRSFLSSPNTPSLPVLISSTDVRTPKVIQLTSTSSKSEIVWWIEGTQQQFRLLADVYIVSEPQNDLNNCFKQHLERASRGSGLASLKEEDWESRRVELFKSMSPYMKASWCRPTPGSKLEGGRNEAKKWPETIVEPDENKMNREEYKMMKKLWDMALKNFALMIMDPIQVEFCDLGVIPNSRLLFRKHLHTDSGGVEWAEEELVP